MTPSRSTPAFTSADGVALGAHLAAVSELTPSAAEAHGVLCALIGAGVAEPEETWLAELLAGTDPGDLSVRDCRASLNALAADTRSRLEGGVTGLRPLLPAEAESLSTRALGLYDWSRGFLYGLGLAGVAIDELPPPVREAVEDLAEITRLDLDTLEEGEENEQALAELEEFVWVAAMLVYEQLGRQAASP